MRLYAGHLLDLQLLLTVHDDGTHELAVRTDASETWSRPMILEPVPA